MLYLLNTAILTSYGRYDYQGPLTIEQTTQILHQGFTSAIGHQSTASLLEQLLQLPISVNRMSVKMQSGDTAVIFKLQKRPPEGQVLDQQQLEALGYEFGLLRKLDNEAYRQYS